MLTAVGVLHGLEAADLLGVDFSKVCLSLGPRDVDLVVHVTLW